MLLRVVLVAAPAAVAHLVCWMRVLAALEVALGGVLPVLEIAASVCFFEVLVVEQEHVEIQATVRGLWRKGGRGNPRILPVVASFALDEVLVVGMQSGRRGRTNPYRPRYKVALLAPFSWSLSF